MINLKDILKDSGVELGKVYTDKDMPPFQVNEYGSKTSELVGTPKNQFGSIHNMKEDMKQGKFDPKNPQVLIHGFGVYNLKTLEKVIARDLKECTSRGAEYTAMALYRKHSTTEAKIKAANDVYKEMETSKYKRAVTMYKKRRK
tara:strand:- start:716 stop:1147 length:432 start_codon:yes stop_codon:yes gene_type:complete